MLDCFLREYAIKYARIAQLVEHSTDTRKVLGSNPSARTKMFIFIKEAVKGFVKQGSLFPSSLFLTRQMLKPINPTKGIIAIELGAGSGAFTLELLKKIPVDGKLIIFEINKNLADYLKEKVTDSRCLIIQDDACNIRKHLRKMNIDEVDYIVSGLPIGNFKRNVRSELLQEIKNSLKQEGVYIQFQYFLANWNQIRKMFDAKIIAYEFRNLPPAFVYKCHKVAQ